VAALVPGGADAQQPYKPTGSDSTPLLAAPVAGAAVAEIAAPLVLIFEENSRIKPQLACGPPLTVSNDSELWNRVAARDGRCEEDDMETIFRGVFLTSETPEEAARFYQQVALLPLEAVGAKGEYIYWQLDRNGMQLAIHDAKAFAAYTHPSLSGSNLTHLYFKVEDQQTFLAHLDKLGVSPWSVDDVVVTVVDPDGRKVMFGTV
jgi:hypothetical protein